MFHSLKELPKGWYQKAKITNFYLNEDSYLQKEEIENGAISYWFFIGETKTLIPNWFFEEAFLNKDKLSSCSFSTCTKYFYLNEKYEEHYIYEGENFFFYFD